jgi:hypothetical protein
VFVGFIKGFFMFYFVAFLVVLFVVPYFSSLVFSV